MSASSPAETGSCPAVRSAPWSFEPKSRSGHSSATRAMISERTVRASTRSSLRAAAVELLTRRLGTAPHLHDLHAPGARLAQRELARDSLVVEQPKGAAHRLGRRGVSEGVSRAQAPVPVVLRVGHGV